MVMADSVTESVLRKASDLSYKHESFTKNSSDEVYARICFLVKFQAFTKNGSDRVCDGVSFSKPWAIPINMKVLL